MGHHLDVLLLRASLDGLVLDLLGVSDQRVRSSEGALHCHRRRLLPSAVAWVGSGIMDRDHQRVASEQWQSQVEPEMPLLNVHDIRGEPPDLSHQLETGTQLAQRLAKAGLVERRKLDTCRQRRLRIRDLSTREHQADVGVATQGSRQSECHLTEIECEESDAKASRGCWCAHRARVLVSTAKATSRPAINHKSWS